jgi:hypothetical protein
MILSSMVRLPISLLLSNAGEETWCWSKAGAKGLQLQLAQDVDDVGFLP